MLFSAVAIVRISGSMQRSAEMMRAMQELVKASDVSKMMHELSREMMKACSVVLYCIYSIHLYSTLSNAHQSEALPASYYITCRQIVICWLCSICASELFWLSGQRLPTDKCSVFQN